MCAGASMNFYGVVALALLSLLSSVVATDIEGKRWAILVAGSNGYDNYRHQVYGFICNLNLPKFLL